MLDLCNLHMSMSKQVGAAGEAGAILGAVKLTRRFCSQASVFLWNQNDLKLKILWIAMTEWLLSLVSSAPNYWIYCAWSKQNPKSIQIKWSESALYILLDFFYFLFFILVPKTYAWTTQKFCYKNNKKIKKFKWNQINPKKFGNQ